ncbi:MAG TPA: HAD family phosphatase [Dehalococcoidia bacterium]|nr:HAD family phosphatase [Dehalococcoidia bacterium]
MANAGLAGRRGIQIQAVVFDMDGVLLDSEPLHHETVNALLAEEGATLDLEGYLGYVGTTLEDTWGDLVQRFGLKRPFAYYRDRYDAEILRHYAERSVLLPGAAWLVAELRARGKRLAVASSSRTAWVEACLAGLGLRQQFDAVVTGDMVQHGKPDPEIYLKAAAALGVAPERCLAIEDAPKGVQSAHRAGMAVVRVDTPYTESVAIPEADARIHTLAQFDLRWLEAAA